MSHRLGRAMCLLQMRLTRVVGTAASGRRGLQVYTRSSWSSVRRGSLARRTESASTCSARSCAGVIKLFQVRRGRLLPRGDHDALRRSLITFPSTHQEYTTRLPETSVFGPDDWTLSRVTRLRAMTQASLLHYFNKTPSSTVAPPPVNPPPTVSAETPASISTAPEKQSPTIKDDSPYENDLVRTTPVPGVNQACISRVFAEHLEHLKRLTSSILPVSYPDKFYNAILLETEAADFSRVVLYLDKPVGWIRCRLEPVAQESDTKQIYIQALCILAPYREQGLATHLLESILQPILLRKYSVGSVYAHVWESNEDALEWYERRGFKQILLVGQYYKRLKPAGAWIVRKDLGVLDHISPVHPNLCAGR